MATLTAEMVGATLLVTLAGDLVADPLTEDRVALAVLLAELDELGGIVVDLRGVTSLGRAGASVVLCCYQQAPRFCPGTSELEAIPMKTDAYDAYLHVYITARTGCHVAVADDVDTAGRVAAAMAVNDAGHGDSPSTRAEFATQHARMLETTDNKAAKAAEIEVAMTDGKRALASQVWLSVLNAVDSNRIGENLAVSQRIKEALDRLFREHDCTPD